MRFSVTLHIKIIYVKSGYYLFLFLGYASFHFAINMKPNPNHYHTGQGRAVLGEGIAGACLQWPSQKHVVEGVSKAVHINGLQGVEAAVWQEVVA